MTISELIKQLQNHLDNTNRDCDIEEVSVLNPTTFRLNTFCFPNGINKIEIVGGYRLVFEKEDLDV